MKDELSVEDISDLLDTSPTVVNRWAKEGKLKAVKEGRSWKIKPKDLEDFVKAHGFRRAAFFQNRISRIADMEQAGVTRYCSRCRKVLPLEAFDSKRYGKLHNQDGRALSTRECTECRSIRARGLKGKAKIQALLSVARWRAKKHNLPFCITVEDIVIPKRCPVLDIELKTGDGMQRNSSPSLDRIVPEKGYVKGNVIIVSWRANDVRGNATVEELRKVTEFYELLLRTGNSDQQD